MWQSCPGVSLERKANMPDTSEISVLLLDKASRTAVGLIRFDSSGVLVYQSMQAGLHVFAFKPINKLLSEQWLKEPLYKKYANSLDDNKMLAERILVEEANSCADFLNALEGPLMLGNNRVKAKAVFVRSKRPVEGKVEARPGKSKAG
jgi:hypothetical protein